MAKSYEDDKFKWDQVMAIQQELKAHLDLNTKAVNHYTTEQQLIANQIKAAGQAVAALTPKQFDDESPFCMKKSHPSTTFFFATNQRSSLIQYAEISLNL